MGGVERFRQNILTLIFFRVELGGECVVCVVDVGERWKGGVCESIQWERCVTLRVEWRVMSEGPVGGE